MIDPATLAAYDRAAADWHNQPAPADMHALLLKHFRPGPTADIGCGSGRDTAWLAAQGFAVTGYDASEGLLAEARRRYPKLDFRAAALPELAGLPDGGFANILCETVIMHLPAGGIAQAVRRLAALLAPGGTLWLSWRITPDEDRRDEAGRLYTAFDVALVREALAGMTVLFDRGEDSASSGKPVHRLIVRKPD
jgi:2-polyprenyl-3-methyl-5-hydroxy-6-metoxy-1,4-benzoquinol methylase